MKNRTLLLGPCGDCKDHSTNKNRWRLIGRVLKNFNDLVRGYINSGMSESDAIDRALPDLRAVIALINRGNPPGGSLPGEGTFNPSRDLRDEFDDLAARCGFSSK